MSENKKIVLYNPKPNTNLKSRDIPLALLFVSKLLAADGYQVRIFTDLDSRQAILDQAQDALCLGITSMTGHQIIDGLDLSRNLKKIFPQIPIVWGGWHVSLLPEESLKDRNVDIVVRGQGERTFYQLVKRLEAEKDLDGLPGVSYKKAGRIIHNPDRTFEGLDNFPRTPYGLVQVEKYLFPTEFGKKTINYVSSFGCPYCCGFCGEQTISKRHWYALSAPRVVDEIENLVKTYGINALSINDSNFFVREERIKQICQGMIARGFKVKWGNANGNINTMLKYSEQTWQLLRESGCYSILTGSESGSQEALDLIGKSTRVEDNLAFAEKCKQAGIKVIFSNMVGLPWADKTPRQVRLQVDKEIKHTVEDIRRYLALDSRHRALLFTYTPYPGTPLYQNALRLGFKPPAALKEWGGFTHYAQRSPWVTKKQAGFVTMLSSYIFLFLDADFKNWITESIRNKYKKLLADKLVNVFSFLARFRWRHNFFNLPFDYYVYRLIRTVQREV